MSADSIEDEIQNLKRQHRQLTQRIETLQQLSNKRQRCSNRIEEALCLLRHEYLPLDELLTDQFPDLIGNPDFWKAFLQMKTKMPPNPEVYPIINRKQPYSVFQDKNLMLQLCSYDSWLYGAIPDGHPLQNDKEILETVLLFNPCYISTIPAKILALDQHASLIGATLARLPLSITHLSNMIKEFFPPIVWQRQQIVLGWAKGGGTFHNHIPENFLYDKTILLQFQENKKIVPSTLNIPAPLRGDRSSMIALVKSNPINIEQAAYELTGDYALPIAALTTTRGIVMDRMDPMVLNRWLPNDFAHTHSHRVLNHIFLFRTAQQIQKRLQLHDNFIKLILGSIHSTATPSSSLATLNQGNTTSCEAYMKPIAHFLGIPTGNELRNLRAARRTLALLGVHWCDPLHDTVMTKELQKFRTLMKELEKFRTRKRDMLLTLN